jgi:hypothetical protein
VFHGLHSAAAGKEVGVFPPVLRIRIRIRIRIRMDPHDFGPLDPHPESAFQMRIPDADADPG